jgi:3-methyl-2-oxobutanoate hydroxymethyltransferase
VAPIAFAAHDIVLDKDEVALFKPLAPRELAAGPFNDADVFMPHDDGGFRGRFFVKLHIGAADSGNFHPHQGAVFRNIRHRKLAELCVAGACSDGCYHFFQLVLLRVKFYDGAVDKVTLPALQQMKRDGRKIVGVVAWDFQIAQIADRAGIEILSVGDSVGVNLWGHPNELEITLDEMIVVCKAVRRGTKRALVSCDLPFRSIQDGVDSTVRAALRVVKEGGADMVKVDGVAESPDVVKEIVRAGVPVFAQFGDESPEPMTTKRVDDARRMEDAGAALIDFKYSGPTAGPAVVSVVSIPVLGGLGGGPWLDGRMRMAHAAIGYAASWLESKSETYANVARVTLDALTAYAEDVRAGRQIRGAGGPASGLRSR